MARRKLPAVLIQSSLEATAEVLRELRDDSEHPDNPLRRAQVQQFVAQNALQEEAQPEWMRRERKREEREALHAHTTQLVRMAQISRGRHEVKKARARLLKLDQRELRRVLGSDGEELCRQINSWLRATASMF